MEVTRLYLERAKLIRALQILELAYKNGQINKDVYQKIHEKYTVKLQEFETKHQISAANPGMIYKKMEIPQKIQATETESKTPELHIFLDIFLKIAVGILFFCLLGYVAEFAAKQRNVFYAIIAFACPLFYLFIVYLFDKYEPEPISFVVLAFVWGMIAGVLSLWLNNTLVPTIGLTALICIAGFTEEITKGIGLFKLSRHPEYNDPIDGILYGMAVGLGFAAFENLLYFAHFANILNAGMHSELQFQVSVGMRSTLSAIGHACFTGMMGLWLARVKIQKGIPKIKDFIFAYVIAALLHGTFNSVLIFVPTYAFFIIIALIFSCLYLFFISIQKNWEQNREWNSLTVNR